MIGFITRGSRAVLFLVIGDERGADRELAEAIEEVRSSPGISELTFYERYKFVLSVDLLRQNSSRQDASD